MEAQTRKCSILNSDGRIKDAEDQPEPLFVFGPDAGIASSFEKSSQSLMGKTANHENQRNLLRDRLQRVSASSRQIYRQLEVVLEDEIAMLDQDRLDRGDYRWLGR